MPIVPSQFSPPRFLGNGHVQTILPVLIRRRFEWSFERERFELPDGDFVDLHWLRSGHSRLAVISHGLEGSSDENYVRGTAESLHAAGWDTLAWNFRGCGAVLNRLPRLYHSGDTSDLAAIIELVASKYQKIALIGFSLGGNVTLKYLGERPTPPSVIAAAAVSVPIDLTACAQTLDHRISNRVYRRHFVSRLVAKIEAKAVHFPEVLDAKNAHRIRTFSEFDGRYTAPMFGFRDASDYWAKSSARQFLPNINIPVLLLNARNDPFLTPECFPFEEAETSSVLHLEAPQSGGHVGFLDFKDGLKPWCERRAVEFLAQNEGS